MIAQCIDTQLMPFMKVQDRPLHYGRPLITHKFELSHLDVDLVSGSDFFIVKEFDGSNNFF